MSQAKPSAAPAIINVKNVNRGHIPGLDEALFPCEQAAASIPELTNHHPYADAMFNVTELRYLEFEMPKYGTLFTGYWCPQCISALDRQPGNTLYIDLLDSTRSKFKMAWLPR